MKKIKGSATVELVYMMPVILLVCVVSIYIMFYFHDKNILIGAVYETAVVGAQKVKWDEEEVTSQLQKLFEERTRGKFIFFAKASVKIEVSDEAVEVRARAEKGRMKMNASQKVTVTSPEEYIRDFRRIQNVWKQNINED